MAGIKRKTSNEWEAGNSLKNRKTDGSERGALLFTDLAEVLQLLRRHGYSGVSYYNLGLFLDLSPNTLNVIRTNNKDDVESCLRECLTKWLQKADDVQKKGGPTIYSLVSALRELGENGVADGIDGEMHPACKILACHSAQQSLVTALPQLVILLHVAKLIEEIILPTNIQGEDLLTEVKKAVCKDYLKLEAFAQILCQVAPTAETGNTIMKEYKKAFWSNDSLMITGDNAEELKIYLPQSMIKEFKTMRLKFGETFSSVKEIMTENPPAIEKIRDTLKFSYRALKPQIAQCQDINSILELISENCSLNDISMLEFFIDRPEIDELAKQAVQKYNEAITKFSKTKLSQYLGEKLSYTSPLQCERITIVVDVDENAEELMLKDVKRLSANIFHELKPNARLNVIRDGNSFTITCSFPLILFEQLITAALNNIDVLKENKVKRLAIGYCTVYEVNDTSIPTTTEIDEYTSSLSTSSGLMKQLMLSLSVQLINSKEEVTTLNEENMTTKKGAELLKNETESLKETLDTKSKMLSAYRAESDRFKKIAAETKQLLQEKVSHLTESEKENEKLKEIKELLEEQLILFQSEKEEVIQLERSLQEKIEEQDEEMQLLKIQLTSYQEKEGEEESFAEEIKKLQSATDKDEIRHKIVQGLLSQNGKLKGKLSVIEKMMVQLQKELEQKDQTMQQEQTENKQEIKLLQEKITTMNLQQIERDKQVQEKEQMLLLKIKKLEKASPQEKNPLIFQDDIYGGITIDHPLIREIVQTHQFQRLKDIKKLGHTYQNIPKANYSRMEHSIGMYYLAGEYVKQLQRRQPELNITDSDVLCVQIAALCYNLGHGPFSHTFDMFLDAIHEKNKSGKPWKNVLEASVKMFHYMLEDNEGLMASFEKHFDNPKEDIAFIKELIQGTGYEQRKDKKFLHKIVYNKKSGLDVCMIESTVRDAAVLGMNVTFHWKVFLNQVRVLRCDDGELHKCFSKDDLEICNDLFRTRHCLHRDLYYARKSRMAAIMIRRILVKSNDIPIIKDKSRRVAISQATKSMSGYTELTDSVLNNITLLVDDPEVKVLSKCLNTMKVIGQIGYVTPTEEWNEDKITQHIVQSIKSCDISNELIVDPTKHGYENWNALTQYYYTSDGRTGQWTHEWAQPPPSAAKQLRIFLVSGDRVLIKEVQEVLRELITDEQLIPGDIYADEENSNLMPQVPPIKKEEATELKEVASALATV